MTKTIMSDGRPAGYIDTSSGSKIVRAYSNGGIYLGEYDSGLGYTMDVGYHHFSDGDGTIGLIMANYIKERENSR